MLPQYISCRKRQNRSDVLKTEKTGRLNGTVYTVASTDIRSVTMTSSVVVCLPFVIAYNDE